MTAWVAVKPAHGLVLTLISSMHAGESQEVNGLERESGGVSSLYVGTSRRPLQVQWSNQPTPHSTNAAANSEQQELPAESGPDTAVIGEQSGAVGSAPAVQTPGQGGRGDKESRGAKGFPKAKSVEGFLNRLLLASRPSATSDSARRSAASAQLTPQPSEQTSVDGNACQLQASSPSDSSASAASECEAYMQPGSVDGPGRNRALPDGAGLAGRPWLLVGSYENICLPYCQLHGF